MKRLLLSAGLLGSVASALMPGGAALAADGPGDSFSVGVGAQPTAAVVHSYTRASAVAGSTIVQYALKFVGYPYTATGNSPSSGFSCIGFVSYVYRSNGINLPGDLGGAYAFAPRVAFSNLQPGDILYFQNTVWAGLSHAAIYLGGGRFVHAEWYNRGVVTSSFTNDPVDGNYWTAHYLGANRPWTGTAISTVKPASTVAPTPVGRLPLRIAPTATPRAIPTALTSITPSATPGARIVPTPNAAPARAPVLPASGLRATVRVSALNVRIRPSLRAAIATVIQRGTILVILGQQQRWYKVELRNGTIGWVIGKGIGRGDNADFRPRLVLPTATPVSVRALARAHSTPKPRTAARVSAKRAATLIVRVSGLRIHARPSLGAAVVGIAPLNRAIRIVRIGATWTEVQLGNSSSGWISTALTSARSAGSASATVQKHTLGNGSWHTVAVASNVRNRASLASTILRVAEPGSMYRVIGLSGGWAHVRLASGVSGWIRSSLLKLTATARMSSTTTSRNLAASAQPSTTVSTNVRLRQRPTVSSAALRLIAAGTRVRLLSVSAGWAKVQLPAKGTGYVPTAYVRGS